MRSVTLAGLLLITSAAHAVYVPLNCREALSRSAESGGEFRNWSRVKRMDRTGIVTMLVRVEGENRPFKLPADPRIEMFPTIGFEKDGATYAVIKAPVAAIQDQYLEFAAANGGRRMDFQVIDREGTPDATSLGREVKHLVPWVSALARPWAALDRWLGRFKIYDTTRAKLARATSKQRTQAAERLRSARNPVTLIEAQDLREIQECTSPGCQTPVEPREDAIVRRLEAFFAERVPNLSFRDPGALEQITAEILQQVAPDRYVENERDLARAGLGEFNFERATRDSRLFFLEVAYGLIRSRVFPDNPQPFNLFQIDRTIAEFNRLSRLTDDFRTISIAYFGTDRGNMEFYGPRFDAIDSRFPVTVVAHPNGMKWIILREAYARELGHERLGQLIRRATGSQPHRSTTEFLRTMIEHDSSTGLRQLQLFSPDELVDVALMRQAATYWNSVNGALWIVPMSLPGQFVYAEGFEIRGSRSNAALERHLERTLGFALDLGNGIKRQMFETHDQVYAVDFTHDSTLGHPPKFTIISARPVTRREEFPFYRQVAAAKEILPIKDSYQQTNGFVFEGQPLSVVRMDPPDVVESVIKYGIFLPTIEAALKQARLTQIGANRCAEVWMSNQLTLKLCFARVLKSGVASLKSVRPK